MVETLTHDVRMHRPRVRAGAAAAVAQAATPRTADTVPVGGSPAHDRPGEGAL